MVTVIRVTPSEAAAALTATESWSTSSAAADSTNSTSSNENRGGKKRALPSGDAAGGNEAKKRYKKADGFKVDLTGVPPQLPILKRKGYIVKEGKSKYAGVSLIKQTNKWMPQITIDGKLRYIGSYESEEDAAIDFARAVFKYKGEEALAKLREQNSSGPAPGPAIVIDLSGVPPQPPILKSKECIKEGASKYTGAYFSKPRNKWVSQIKIEGKQRHIGCYENEEEAAADYARAVFKYRGKEALDKARVRKSDKEIKRRQVDRFVGVIDLSDVPPQPPIPKSNGRQKEGASKYAGACFDKASNKWKAEIWIDGKNRHIGYYENEEEAAVDYARAKFKYKGEGMKKAEQRGELHTA